MNNDFLFAPEAIQQWFSYVTSSLVKIIAESPHSWQKIIIHGNSCIILYFLHGQYYGFWCIGDTKNRGISSQGIDLINPEKIRISTPKVLMKIKNISLHNIT